MGDVQIALPPRTRGQVAEFIVTVELAGEPVSVLFREVE